jgi:hypothetical protein
VKFISVSRAHAKLLTSEVSFKWRNGRLHIENGIYFSPDINISINVNSKRTGADADVDASTNFWKQLFLQNYPKRNLWIAASRNKRQHCTRTSQDPRYGNDKSVHKFQLTVSARFKPKGMDQAASTNTNQHQQKISLPLHQRLALIRMNRNITSQREAFKVLMHQGGWFGAMLQKSQAGEKLDYDADENWGQIEAVKLGKKFNIENIFIPSNYESKDFSDLIQNKGIVTAKLILEKIIDETVPF